MRTMLLMPFLATMLLSQSVLAYDAFEWLVCVRDVAAEPNAKVHLPRFVQSRRSRAIGDGAPAPSGGIVFSGQMPDMFDAVVRLPGQPAIAGVWPAATTRDGVISWSALRPATTAPIATGWWQELRGETPPFGRDNTADSFLYYDAELDLLAGYELKSEGDAITVTGPEGAAEPELLLLFRHSDNGLQGAAAKLGDKCRPTATVTVADQLSAVLAPCPERLRQHLVATVEAALAGSQQAAVLVLSADKAGVRSELLPLPDRHQRIIVGVINSRETMSASEWDKLVTSLGAAQWVDRESATATLSKAGRSALPALRRALNGKCSLEVRVRAENLLIRLGVDPESKDDTGAKKTKKPVQNGGQQDEW